MRGGIAEEWTRVNTTEQKKFCLGSVLFSEAKIPKDPNLKNLYQLSIDTDVGKVFIKISDKSEMKGIFGKEWYLPHHPLLNLNKQYLNCLQCCIKTQRSMPKRQVTSNVYTGQLDQISDFANDQEPWQLTSNRSFYRFKFSNRIEVDWGFYCIPKITNLSKSTKTNVMCKRQYKTISTFHPTSQNLWRINWSLQSTTIFFPTACIWTQEVDKQQRCSYRSNPGKLGINQQPKANWNGTKHGGTFCARTTMD